MRIPAMFFLALAGWVTGFIKDCCPGESRAREWLEDRQGGIMEHIERMQE